MRTLSKQAEEKLLAAIEKAASYVNGGLSPNEAIVKSASESNIPAGHINLMVHAYNTGRTTKQREQGENTLEKAADFALADADTVLDSLFPKQVKTSQEIVRESVVSTEYAVSPAGMLARRQAQQQKVAAAQHSWSDATYVRPPRDDKEEARRQYSQKVAEQREYEELRRVASAAYQKAASAMEALHDYFRRPGNMAFQDAVAETEIRYGDEAVSVLRKVAAVYPHLEKQAATRLAHFGECEPCNLAADVLRAVEEYNAAEKQAELKKKPEQPIKKEATSFLTGSILHDPLTEPLTLKEANSPRLETIFNPDGGEQKVQWDPAATGGAGGWRPVGAARPPRAQQPSAPRLETMFDDEGREYRARWDNAQNKYVPEGGKKALPPKTPDKKENKPGILSGAAGAAGEGVKGTLTELARSMADSTLLPTDPAAMKNQAYAQLTDPDHEMQLRNIRAQSVLNDMILNDPVISGFDPSEVSLAFNELAEVAPSMVESPAAMQALLRKRLEAGQLADFDIKQLMDMEKLKSDTQKNLLESKRTQRELL